MVEVVVVEVSVPEGVDKDAGFQAADLSHHVGEQRIGGNVERNAEEDIGASLVELTIQTTIGHMKLEEGVARHEGHFIEFTHVPG